MLEQRNEYREHPGTDRPDGKGKRRGPYPRELPLPRSLPAGGNSVPRRCPPQDEGAGAFPFYGG